MPTITIFPHGNGSEPRTARKKQVNLLFLTVFLIEKISTHLLRQY